MQAYSDTSTARGPFGDRGTEFAFEKPNPTRGFEGLGRAEAAWIAVERREAIMPARKRELIEPHDGDKRYIRRDGEGHFTDDQVDVGRSLSQDMKRQAKHTTSAGQGDKGDRKKK